MHSSNMLPQTPSHSTWSGANRKLGTCTLQIDHHHLLALFFCDLKPKHIWNMNQVTGERNLSSFDLVPSLFNLLQASHESSIPQPCFLDTQLQGSIPWLLGVHPEDHLFTPSGCTQIAQRAHVAYVPFGTHGKHNGLELRWKLKPYHMEPQ